MRRYLYDADREDKRPDFVELDRGGDDVIDRVDHLFYDDTGAFIGVETDTDGDGDGEYSEAIATTCCGIGTSK